MKVGVFTPLLSALPLDQAAQRKREIEAGRDEDGHVVETGRAPVQPRGGAVAT